MNIENEVERLLNEVWNIPFRELHHTINTVCDYVSPIAPDIDRLKYFRWLIAKIEFDKIGFDIESGPTSKDTLAFCDTIHFVLESMLKTEIDKRIKKFLDMTNTLSEIQRDEKLEKLIQIVGKLQTFTSKNKKDESFSKRYLKLRKGIEAKGEIGIIDYQILITNFNETISNYLEREFKIIVETLKSIPERKPIRVMPTKSKIRPVGKDSKFIVKSTFRPAAYPEFLSVEKEAYLLAKEIESLMHNDKNSLTSIELFKNKTRHVFNLTTPKNQNNLKEYLINRATDHISLKYANEKYDTGTYVENVDKRIGGMFVHSEAKKAPQRHIAAKIKTLEAYLDWLKMDFGQLSSDGPLDQGDEFRFQNNFDHVNETVVYEHFKKYLVESKMLSMVDCQLFIKMAFDECSPPKVLFSLKKVQSKAKVMKVFHNYYHSLAGKPFKKSELYASLLGDYFQGYKTSSVKSNWSK